MLRVISIKLHRFLCFSPIIVSLPNNLVPLIAFLYPPPLQRKMSQTSDTSINLESLTIRSHDDSSSESYTIIHGNQNDEDDDDAYSNSSSGNEGSGYVDFLIEAYDFLLSCFASMKVVALAGRIALRHIHQKSVIQEAVTMIGEDAVHKLAIVGSIQGTNISKIDKNIKIVCSGERVNGTKTIKQLVQCDILSKRGSKYDSSNNKIHLNLISAAIPYAAFQSMMDTNNSNEVFRKKYRSRITTTLPLQLQYLAAGSLPLGPKTRKAHLNWSAQFLKSIRCKFNPVIYKRLMGQSVVYENMESLTQRLDIIEDTLTLNSEEEAIEIKRFFKKYYAIAQIAKSENAGRASKRGNLTRAD